MHTFYEKARVALTSLAATVGSKWVWLPIFFFVSVLFSVYCGVALGFYGFFLPYWWVFLWVIKEIRREVQLDPKPKDGYITSSHRLDQILEAIEKERAKYRPI